MDVASAGSGATTSIAYRDPSEMRETCALDVADRGAATLDTVGEFLGITRARAGQIEQDALYKIRSGKAL